MVCYVVGLSSLSKVKKFVFLSWKRERGCVFGVFFARFLEKGSLDYIAHRPTIQGFTESELSLSLTREVSLPGR